MLIHLDSPEITIERSKEKGQIAVLSKKSPKLLSRKHCFIKKETITNTADQEEEVYKIIDNNSMNGTFVNYIRVTEKVLKDGDTVILGGGGDIDYGGTLTPGIHHICYLYNTGYFFIYFYSFLFSLYISLSLCFFFVCFSLIFT